MIESEFITLISNMGFPIAIALYFMVSLKKTLEKLEGTISNNTNIINELCIKMGRK